MTISYYIHAWQGLLMFLAGLISVGAAFGGYIQGGGGEELLRYALDTQFALNTQNGTESSASKRGANFESINLNWYTGEMIVRGLHYEDYTSNDKSVELKNLAANEFRVKMDLFPWPPKINAITVQDMPSVEVHVKENVLQSGTLRRPVSDLPPIRLVNCNLKLKVGDQRPIEFTGCSGELRQGSGGEMRGGFSLRQLNGKPFNFKLEALEDGRWDLSGESIQLDTRGALNNTLTFGDTLDPVNLLLKALFSGEMGAEGEVSHLHVVVQPATDKKKFSCDGQVAYSKLEVRLPSGDKPTGQVLPFFLNMLLGANQNQPLWPPWMQVDKIRSGERGRVFFHMADGRLDFSSDEGPESAFTGIRGGTIFPPLESLKGSVETDAENHPRRILLRGYLGSKLSFETVVQRSPDDSRVYELILTPRAGTPNEVAFGQPQWRFVSRVRDFSSLKRTTPSSPEAESPLADFELEFSGPHFPYPEFLPSGIADVGGRLYARGNVTRGLLLTLNDIRLDDDATISYRKTEGSRQTAQVWEALQNILATDPPTVIDHLDISARAQIEIMSDLKWKSAKLTNCVVKKAAVVHGGNATDIDGLKIDAQYKRESDERVEFNLNGASDWQAQISAQWNAGSGKAVGTCSLDERSVPVVLHPRRKQINSKHIKDERVTRTVTASFAGEQVTLQERP